MPTQGLHILIDCRFERWRPPVCDLTVCSAGSDQAGCRSCVCTYVVIDDSAKVQVEEVQAFSMLGALGRRFMAREMSYKQYSSLLCESLSCAFKAVQRGLFACQTHRACRQTSLKREKFHSNDTASGCCGYGGPARRDSCRVCEEVGCAHAHHPRTFASETSSHAPEFRSNSREMPVSV